MVMAMKSSHNPHSSRQFIKGLKAKRITTWRFVGHENVSALLSKQSEVCWTCGYRLRSSQLQTAAFDDKAKFQESELAALKPTLLVADWNALEVEISIQKRVKSSAAGNDLG